MKVMFTTVCYLTSSRGGSIASALSYPVYLKWRYICKYR